MSKPVVSGFVSKRCSEERPVIVAEVMDHNFFLSFSTVLDEYFAGKRFQVAQGHSDF